MRSSCLQGEFMQSDLQQNEFLFYTEEKTIKHAESIIQNNNFNENQWLKEYKKLLKRYKKLFKQLKNLISMTDRQQKQVNRLNSELMQTNKLLADVSGDQSLTISRHHIKELSTITSHLVLTKNQLLSFEHAQNNQTDYLSLLQNLNIVTASLQDCILKTKLQPLTIVYTELPGIISQYTKNQNKDIQLNLDGKNVKIDNDFLDSLRFILCHLVENACLHGIETKLERKTLSKPSVGNINITAANKDKHVIIEFDDDGKGFDFQSVFKNRDQLYPIELKQWIDHLKTSHQRFNNYSGLQQIHDKVEAIKGSIRIQNSNRQGLRYLLKFPESIAIMQGMIVEVSGERFIIPKDYIAEVISVYDSEIISQIEFLSEHEVIRLREKLTPLIRLKEVLKRPEPFNSDTRMKIAQKYQITHASNNYQNEEDLLFLVMKAEKERFAVVIDKIVGNEEIVYMPLHSLVKHLPLYSGMSILGDGCVSMILDPEGIFKHVDIHIDTSDTRTETIQQNSKVQRILIFKSGSKEQFAVFLAEVARLVRIKKSDIQYKSDLPLIAIDGVVTQLILLDQYLKVSPLISSDILYVLLLKNMDRPSGILMSGMGGIHSVEILIETDTFVDKGVLGTMKIEKKLTIFLDVLSLARMAVAINKKTRQS